MSMSPSADSASENREPSQKLYMVVDLTRTSATSAAGSRSAAINIREERTLQLHGRESAV